tara:strand:+ start:1496 stop:1939 length:444 start_codon:yes stop_codon:yes gene_type:complete
MLFHKTTIRSEIVDEIIETVHKHKSNFVDVSHSTATEKGFQSPNILTIFDINLIKEMLDNQCLYQDIFHIHYIEYSNGGFQKPHNHFKSEEYSFILYLNDAVGDTIFSHTTITPKKGLLIIFDSSLEHSGKESINKKILVGAIKNKS